MRGKSVGARVLRSEDARLLRGRGEFVDDIALPHLLHTAFVRASHAHARILSVDVASALALRYSRVRSRSGTDVEKIYKSTRRDAVIRAMGRVS